MEGRVDFIDGVKVVIAPDGSVYRYADIQRYNNPGAQVDDRTGELMASMPSADVAPTPPDERSLGSRVGNEDIAAGVRMMTDADASLYNLLDPSGRYSSTLLGRVNRAALSPLDMLLGGLTAGSGVAQKGMGYASDALGLDLRPGDIPTAEEQGQLADALYALPASRMLGAISEAGGRAATSRAVVDRLNQPGPVPTMGSNFGNLGHNGGPPVLLGRGDVRSYSAALRSAENLKQQKGPYEQLKAMMLKEPGVKADEFQWTGADAAFSGQKVTKEQLIDFFSNATETLGEEVRVGGKPGVSRVDLSPEDMARQYVEQNLDTEARYYLDEYLPDLAEQDTMRVGNLTQDELNDLAAKLGVSPDSIDPDAFVDDDLTRLIPEDELVEYRFGDPEYTAREMAEEGMYENALYEARQDPVDFAERTLGITEDDLYSNTEYSEYFPKGGTSYAERLYTYEDPTGRINQDSLAAQGHYGDDPENPMIAWARTAEFPAYGQGYVRNVETGDVFPHNPNSAWERSLLAKNPGKYQILSEGGPAGRGYYIGEIQSDAAQRLQKRGEETGMVPRNYDQTIAAQDYSRAIAPYNEDARKAYYDFADAFSDIDPDIRARMASDVAWSNFRRAFPDMPATAGELTDEQADVFFNWPAGYIGAQVNTPADAMRWARALEYTSTGNDRLDAMAANMRASKDAGDAAKQQFSNLLAQGADVNKFMPAGPLLDRTGKWTEFALRRNLEDAILSGADYLAVPNDRGAIGMVGGGGTPTPGAVDYYENIVQNALKNLARKYDKKAGLLDVMLGEGNEKFPAKGIRLTPEFIDAVAKKGIPIWMLGGTGVLGSGLLESYNQNQQPSAGLLGGM